MALVSDILKIKGKNVYNVHRDATVLEALELMAEKNIGALLIMEGSNYVGIFSERDFVREAAKEKMVMLKMPVESFMTKEVFCVSPEDSIEECMALMTVKHIRHLPVCHKGETVGLISIGDVVKYTIEDKNLLINNMEDYILGRGFGK